jgi:hypothetical protein
MSTRVASVRLATASVFAFVTLAAATAFASDSEERSMFAPRATDGQPSRGADEVTLVLDPLFYPGASSLAVGLILVGGGYGGADRTVDTRACGLTGCIEQTSDESVRSRAVLAAGASATAAGTATLLIAVGRDAPEPTGAEARTVAGAALIDMGAGALGYGVGLVAFDRGEHAIDELEAEAGAFLAVGGASVAVGSALVLSGALANTRDAPRNAFRSQARAAVGIALTTLGAVGFGGSVVYATAKPCSGAGSGYCGMAGVIRWASMAPAVAALGVGIPLWITGSATSSEAPDVRFTGDRLTAAWSFQ